MNPTHYMSCYKCYARRAVPGLCLILLLWGLEASAAELKRITLGYPGIGPMATGFWMAKEIGAFEKHGLQAEIIYISSGPVVVQALLGGDIQGGSAASNAVINAVLNGAPIVGVAGTANRPYHRLYVQPEINRIEDLRGKTLGVTRFGSITDNLTRILLRRNGLENAVTVRQLGATAAVGAAFQQRIIAGAVTSEIRAGAKVPAKILVSLADLGIPYSMHMITVAREYYRRSPDVVEGMVRAYTEGVAALNNQKDRALKIIAKYSRLRDSTSIEEHYRDAVTYLDRVPRVEPEAISTILEFMGKPGMPHKTFVDDSIIERMVGDGFVDKKK
ncbi:MAG: ABC transporter substrate-binding protein [Deltaproteobacteria bacterium]|nr:ABC transporter substrate-binding protein [Deltaproteobacteria bacterium]